MAITKEKKENICAKIQQILKDYSTIVFVNFHGLTVGDTTQLRRNLRQEQASYLVAKKTLVKKALEKLTVAGEQPVLEGELALAFGEDQIASARGIYEFQKKHKDNLSILGGIFEGAFMDKEKMLSIAQIPPLKTLYGQFANIINSPIQGLVIALDKIAEKRESVAV